MQLLGKRLSLVNHLLQSMCSKSGTLFCGRSKLSGPTSSTICDQPLLPIYRLLEPIFDLTSRRAAFTSHQSLGQPRFSAALQFGASSTLKQARKRLAPARTSRRLLNSRPSRRGSAVWGASHKYARHFRDARSCLTVLCGDAPPPSSWGVRPPPWQSNSWFQFLVTLMQLW